MKPWLKPLHGLLLLVLGSMFFLVPALTMASPTLLAVNLAQGKSVTVSSIEGSGFEGARAVDGNLTSRWASLEGIDPQWLQIDLGAAYAINRVVLTWEVAYGRAYRVETSANASTWTTIYSTTSGDGNTDDLTVSGSGRYVRIYGTTRGTSYGYSLYEVAVYGADGVTPPPATATTQPPTATRVPATATPRPATATPPPATATPGTTCPDAAWERTSIYVGGDRVSHASHTWRAKWWTQGEEPGTTGQWGVWEDLGTCGGTNPTATPPPATATPRPPTVTPPPATATPRPPTATPPPATATPRPPTATPPPGGGTPASINGQLRVCGVNLCNQYNKPIQLRGMSTHGLQWYGWGNCVTASSLTALANDWKADILRISLYVQEGGYETNPAGFRAQVDTIIENVSSRGMYALIDWHMLDPGDPYYNLDRAKEYFTYMAQKHGNKTNILYEIANEPNGVNWSRIKSYAEELIPVIRANDPDAVIIVGTPDWSSFGVSGSGGRASTIVANPVNATNILYSFHFYAASHTQEYRDELSWAADRLPVFVTEWGSQEYTGDGPNDFTSTQAYIDLMAAKKISWTSWNYSDDERSGAAFKPGTCAAGGPWSGSSLKQAGTWVRDKILNPPDNFPTN